MSENEFRAAVPHRPRVRIVEHRVNWRGAIGTLAVTATAAALVLILWRLWRTDETPAIHIRKLADVDLEWKCDGNHSFMAMGSVGPQHCKTCKQPAFPVVKYKCDVHGPIDVMARFGGDAPGSEKLTHLRVIGREWTPADKPLLCPKCGKEIRRQRADTFVSPSKAKEKSQGG